MLPEIFDGVHATILYFLSRELYDLSAMCEMVELKSGIKLSKETTALLAVTYLMAFDVTIGEAWNKREVDSYIAQAVDSSFSSALAQQDAGHRAIIQKAFLPNRKVS